MEIRDLGNGVFGVNDSEVVKISEEYEYDGKRWVYGYRSDAPTYSTEEFFEKLGITIPDKKYCYILNGYETYTQMLLFTDEVPEPLSIKGNGFSHGSTNVIKNPHQYKHIVVVCPYD
jgi:hypothetical protein